jgi:hypothetical protein
MWFAVAAVSFIKKRKQKIKMRRHRLLLHHGSLLASYLLKAAL